MSIIHDKLIDKILLRNVTQEQSVIFAALSSDRDAIEWRRWVPDKWWMEISM